MNKGKFICETELYCIGRELSRRRLAGKTVVVAGLALGAASLAGCTSYNDTNVVVDVATSGVRQNDADNRSIFEDGEIMPVFPGGTPALMAYIKENLRWPDSDSTVSGRVIVTFIIDKEGYVKDAKVVRSLAPEFDAEALRIVRGMPRWVPGRMFGKALDIRYALPVRFNRDSSAVRSDSAL